MMYWQRMPPYLTTLTPPPLVNVRIVGLPAKRCSPQPDALCVPNLVMAAQSVLHNYVFHMYFIGAKVALLRSKLGLTFREVRQEASR